MPPLDKMLGGGTQVQIRPPEDLANERKPSAVEIGAAELTSQHTRLDALVSELERKISAVLIPVQGGQGQNPRPPDPVPLSPMASGLRGAADAVRAIADRLDGIIARVDL